MFIILFCRTTKDVIPRRGKAPTWESPVIRRLRSIDRGDCHVAWLVPAMLLAMTVVVDGWLRRFEQNDKLKLALQYRIGWGQWCVVATGQSGSRWPSALADKL